MRSLPSLRSASLGRLLGASATVPVVLLLLLAIAGGLAVRLQTAERSHRATADRALREYAGFAAWQVARRDEQEYLGCLARSSTFRAYTHVLRTGEPLPSAALLDPEATGTSCGFAHDARVAFRITVPEGTLSTSRTDTAAARMIARLAPTLLAAASSPPHPKATRADVVRRSGEQAQLRFDKISGIRVGIVFAPMRDSAGTTRAIFGVVGSLGSRLVHDFDDILDRGPLLPPAFTGNVPVDSVVRIRVTFADGTPVYERGVRQVSQYAATDSVPAALGGLIVHAALASAVTSSLLGGRLPGSRLPFVLALVALGAALTGVALLQLQRSRELDRLRTRFVADVSHELRTPLAHIAMFSETLALGRERSPAERRQFALTIQRETRRLTMLVESVLRFSRPEAARSARGGPLPDPRDVSADVRDAVNAFAPLAAAEEVTLDVVLTDGVHALVDADAVRQITFNLLDNAVKYGPRGQRVTIHVASNAGEVLLCVEDEGPGIPVTDRMRVFEPFTRLERPAMPHVAGTGIGLAVVHDLVAGLGGRVWVEDTYGTVPRGARVVCAFHAAPSATTSTVRLASDIVVPP